MQKNVSKFFSLRPKLQNHIFYFLIWQKALRKNSLINNVNDFYYFLRSKKKVPFDKKLPWAFERHFCSNMHKSYLIQFFIPYNSHIIQLMTKTTPIWVIWKIQNILKKFLSKNSKKWAIFFNRACFLGKWGLLENCLLTILKLF